MKKIVDLFFPPLCLNCFVKVTEGYFCNSCSQHFEFKENTPMAKIISALEDQGPVLSLVKNLKSGHLPKLYKGAAAFLFYAISKQKWLPDLITYIPRKPFFKMQEGASLFLAREVSLFMNIPLKKTLRYTRKDGGYHLIPKVEHLNENKLLIVALEKENLEEARQVLKSKETLAISLI